MTLTMRHRACHVAPLLLALLAGACGSAPPPPPQQQQAQQAAPLPPPLPDTTGWGVQALAAARAPAGDFWVGTADEGVFVLRRGGREWARVPLFAEGAPGAVNSLAAQTDSVVWYGTAGRGFGVTRNGGATFRNWTAEALGGRWQWVAPGGIRTRGDTVYVGTSDGLRITWDGGTNWRCVQARERANAAGADGCTERIAALPTNYLLSLHVTPAGAIWLGHLRGISVSRDAGRTWLDATLTGVEGPARVRAIASNDSVTWAATETAIVVDSAQDATFRTAPIRPPGWDGLPGAPRAIVLSPASLGPTIATSFGLVAPDANRQYRVYYLAAGETYRPAADIWSLAWWGPPLWPIGTSSTGLSRILAGETRLASPPRPTATARPEAPRRPWLGRPVADDDGNPHITPPYRAGTAAPGEAPLHGAVFRNPAGTPVRAVAAGRVLAAGAADAGDHSVAILHDGGQPGAYIVARYHHGGSTDVAVGQRVAAGEVIARVGADSPAGARLRLEIHAHAAEPAGTAPAPDEGAASALNPELWIAPRPGTGAVAGRVLDANGGGVPGARVFGLVRPYPDETPFSYAESYAPGSRLDPVYEEHFAVTDIPAGDYTVGVQIGGDIVWRRVVVAAGQLTFVEFRP